MTPSDLKTRKTSQGASLNGDSFISYSLNFEDVILHRLFPLNQTGFYVDVGAGHPRFENDTFSLYQMGWRGINIEPNHGFHATLTEERPRDINLRVVLSDSFGGVLTYYELNGSGLSTCDAEQATVHQASGRDVVLREVPVTTLSSVITEAGIDHINILKVDVEGFEEKVLNGNDWDKFRPDVVVVEATYPESPIRRPTNILSVMEQRGYRHVHFDGLNDFFLEREFAAPEGLTLPPNVFDHFVPTQVADLRSQVESLRTSVTTAEEYALSLQGQKESLQTQVESLRTSVTTAEEYALSLQGEKESLQTQVESLRTGVTTAEEYALSLQTQAASLRTNFTAAEEYALSLRTQVDEAFRTADALAVENRRIGHQTAHLASENRRLRRAGEQMRAELLILNQLLEPLHSMAEQMERQHRHYENELTGAKNELAGARNELAGAKNELAGVRNELAGARNELVSAIGRLASTYSSRCWRLTAPLRWWDGIQRRIVIRLRKRLCGDL